MKHLKKEIESIKWLINQYKKRVKELITGVIAMMLIALTGCNEFDPSNHKDKKDSITVVIADTLQNDTLTYIEKDSIKIDSLK